MVTFAADPTPFVGRQAELAQIRSLLGDPACRLLTLVGPGGMGKTRLVLEAARRLPGPESIHFIALQPFSSPEYLVSTLGNALGFQFDPSADPKQQLLDFLQAKTWLLVLDNFEQLLDGATLLSEILEADPRVRLLVTSRERLNLVEEWVLNVDGLAYPSGGHDYEVERYSAIELFVEHAHRMKASFMLTEVERPAVVRICRLVGGMPLGIELAASWVRALSCETIADEIEQSLDILETTVRNVEPRHRTMRAAFEPTWERLTDHERDVFMKLSVFRGGFTREAAKAVTGASLRTLSALVDKSLVRVDAVGRYDLHELLRQYAGEKLIEAGEAETTLRGHLDYFLKFAEQVEAHNFGPEQTAWYDRAEVELENLRAALERSADSEPGLRIAAALGWFFSERAHMSEGLSWSERAIVANPNAPPSLRAKALHNAAMFPARLGVWQETRVLCQQALALSRPANDSWNIAWALSHLANFGRMAVDSTAVLFEESLALFRTLDDAMGLTHTLIRRSWNAEIQEDYTYARALIEEALGRADQAGDLIMIGWATCGLGRLCMHDHDLGQAKAYFERSLSYFRKARFELLNQPLLMLALVEQASGNTDHAQTLCREFLLGRFSMPRSRVYLTSAVAVVLMSVAKNQGQFERAARLLGAANITDLSPEAHQIRYYPEISLLDSDMASVRAQLGEAAFVQAWTEGNVMAFQEAMAYAVESLDTFAGLPPAELTGSEMTQPSISLSIRELEILRLMADGLSNGDIAEQLVLARSTVKWYVHEILSKLDATSRTQAVAHAQSLGLLS